MSRNGALFRIAVLGAVVSIASVCFPSYSISQGSPSGGTMSGPGVPSANFAMSGGSYGGAIGGGNSTASCTGPSTWDFGWTGNDSLPYELVVKKTVNIQAESWQFGGGGPGSVSVSGPSGLAVTTVTTPIFGPPGVTIGWYTKKSISGTVYEVLGGASEISTQVPMSASATSSSGSMSASAWSTVTLHPVVVSVDDLVDVDGTQTAPIGAKLRATVSVEGLSLTGATFNWGIFGGMPFQSYDVTGTTASVNYWQGTNSSVQEVAFRKEDDVEFACGVTLPQVGFPVNGKLTIKVDEPMRFDVKINRLGSFKLFNSSGETNSQYAVQFRLQTQGSSNDLLAGRRVNVAIIEPESVTVRGGTSIAQLVQRIRIDDVRATRLDGTVETPYTGLEFQWLLDKAYPYGSRGSCVQPDDEAQISLQFNDSPGFEGIDLYKSLTYKADFETSFMFKPQWLSSWAGSGLNSQWVPYYVSLWSATGSASRADAQASWTISLNTTVSDPFSAPTQTWTHPVWSGVLGS